MSKYRDMAKKALKENKNRVKKTVIVENYLYEDGITERMHPQLEEDLRKNRHSLADCGIFPEGDVISSEMKLIRERFKEVVERCREAFDLDEIDDQQIMMEMMPLVNGVMEMEGPHTKKLEQLAVEMVMEEFDIPEGSVIFEAKLSSDIDRIGTVNDIPEFGDDEFNDHDEKVNANEEVHKRRGVNALIQGGAKNVNHMFHTQHEVLSDMNPRLPGNYKKMMSAADYMYYIMPDMDKGKNGGKCDVEYEEDEDGNLKPMIKATAMVFPVLLHELVKGVLEILASHGLPTQENIAKYVIDKADFIKAEPWDMRFGPKMFTRMCEAMPADKFPLKHHVFMEICSLPAKEFKTIMKEILEKTKKSKQMVGDILLEVEKEMQEDDFNEAEGNGFFNLEDLF